MIRFARHVPVNRCPFADGSLAAIVGTVPTLTLAVPSIAFDSSFTPHGSVSPLGLLQVVVRKERLQSYFCIGPDSSKGGRHRCFIHCTDTSAAMAFLCLFGNRNRQSLSLSGLSLRNLSSPPIVPSQTRPDAAGDQTQFLQIPPDLCH